ncbi:Hypothetical predicted protein [Mytilus galloprovincialis]|uniref:Novel STAND NTPase 3 domain-containing protein n=1 Tax=Mytilus galloprovincialis TaxID=29158 RepID=A0A8B6FGS0_MYTGA|nr:Hypothetical predicted protein [Mytilus galloprovincialis]
MYIETNGAISVLKCIKEKGCIVVTGSSGVGKSALVRHVALKMQYEDFDILPVSNPSQIINWFNPSKKNLFVVDNFCGRYTINPMEFENWKNLMEKIKYLVERKPVKLIMSSRLQVYQDEKMKSLSFYKSCECNLLSEELCLSKTEKQSIAELYIKTNSSEIKEFYDKFDFFPLLCQLYSKNTKLKMFDFFKNPFSIYKDDIDKLQSERAYVKYCALALCVMFDNYLKEEWLTKDVNEDIKTIIKNTFEACKVVEGLPRLVVRDELDSLIQTYIRKVGGVYRTIHDKLFDFLAFYYGTVMIDCLINNASSSFIRERFLFERQSRSDEFTIVIPERYRHLYLNRMVDDWSKGNIENVYCNINMDNYKFRGMFLLHIKGLEKSKQSLLASLHDSDNNSTPLLQCCFIGDINLVTWCLNNCKGNVNHCRNGDGVSPLFFACQEGHCEVAQILINNNALIDKCDDEQLTPLYIACHQGHTGVVKMLIRNKANIDMCRNTGSSPLDIACQEGHTQVVQILIRNNAVINKCRDTGATPLYTACQEGHTLIVQMLIENTAEINRCMNTQASPLFAACQKGHTDVVQILIKNKADIFKCRYTGESPLFVACQEGFTEVVKILINNKADIFKCDNKDVSPLYIACQEGHAKVVQMLITNKADINQCRDTGASPLYVACQEGRSDVVQILINNKADIFKCGDKDMSPLYIACEEGHAKVVQMLITNKADINQCRDTGASTFVCCLSGRTF